jgi:hypothetical protein
MSMSRLKFGILLGSSMVAGCGSSASPFLAPSRGAGVYLGTWRRGSKGLVSAITVDNLAVLEGRVPYRYGDFRTTLRELERSRHVDAACPGPDWYAQQHGTAPIDFDMFGIPCLPDGTRWAGTQVVTLYDHGPTMGYVYFGSTGSQWFADFWHAGYPEAYPVYTRNLAQLQGTSYDDTIPADPGNGIPGSKFDIVDAVDTSPAGGWGC